MNENRTRIIVAFDAKSYDPKVLEKTKPLVSGIRLLWDKDSEKKLTEIVDSLRTSQGQFAYPLMIDIASYQKGVVCELAENMEVEPGKTFKIGKTKESVFDIQGADSRDLFVEGHTLFFGYGNVVASVRNVTSKSIELEVVQGGVFHNGMQVHNPKVAPPAMASEIDQAARNFLKATQPDYVLAPGLKGAAEFDQFREQISQDSRSPWILCKVDSEVVHARLDEIMPAVDGVVISRLEMGLSIQPSMIPMLTKEIIQTCNDDAKVVFVASEMLGSMKFNATPTRAEISDIANAVSDGADAIVLSEEVVDGPHGLRAIDLANRTIVDFESAYLHNINWQRNEPVIESEMDAVAFGAYKTAERVGAKAIVCITESGNTALKLSSFQVPVPIIGVTFARSTQNRLNLVGGVSSMYLGTAPNIDEVLPIVKDQLVRDKWLDVGDLIVFVSITISSVQRDNSNLFTVQELT